VNDIVIAVDVAKNVFQIGVSDQPGRICEKHRLPRAHFTQFLATRPAATVVMEACGSAQFWARRIEQLGHRVVLLPPHHVRPYVQRNKTDQSDVKGILEAFRNEEISPVPIKGAVHQAMVALHRLRSGWVVERTARLNALRGLLRELGIFIPVGSRHVLPTVWAHLGDADSNIADVVRPALAEACAEVRDLEYRIALSERQLKGLAKQLPVVQRLMTIPGIGMVTATALVAFIVDIHRFPSGRHFASYLGLTPREWSSGTRRRLGAISKRGDVYLRTLLVHGARSILARARQSGDSIHRDRLREWALRLQESRGHNKATVALANKLARLAWAVWHHETSFLPVAA